MDRQTLSYRFYGRLFPAGSSQTTTAHQQQNGWGSKFDCKHLAVHLCSLLSVYQPNYTPLPSHSTMANLATKGGTRRPTICTINGAPGMDLQGACWLYRVRLSSSRSWEDSGTETDTHTVVRHCISSVVLRECTRSARYGVTDHVSASWGSIPQFWITCVSKFAFDTHCRFHVSVRRVRENSRYRFRIDGTSRCMPVDFASFVFLR